MSTRMATGAKERQRPNIVSGPPRPPRELNRGPSEAHVQRGAQYRSLSDNRTKKGTNKRLSATPASTDDYVNGTIVEHVELRSVV